MARDLNRLFDDLRNSREVYVTRDGAVERADEAAENSDHEERQEGRPKARTRLKPEVFGGDPAVSVAESVIAEAHRLAHQYPVETGAIGVGRDERRVDELIPSGPRAKRSAGSFELDADYLQPLLEKAEARGLRFTCFWHSHPEGCARPSNVDRAAARRMLNDRDWGLPGHVYLPISVRTKTGFATRFFLAEGPDARISEVPTVVVSSPSPRTRPRTASALVTGKLGCFALPLESELPDEARVALDQEALRGAGWATSLRAVADGPALRVERRDLVLWLLLPPEYPVSPPDVYVEESDSVRRIPLSDTPELQPWSSLRSLVTVAEQAWKSVEDLRAVESRIVRPWSFPLIERVRPIRNFLPFLKAG